MKATKCAMVVVVVIGIAFLVTAAVRAKTSQTTKTQVYRTEGRAFVEKALLIKHWEAEGDGTPNNLPETFSGHDYQWRIIWPGGVREGDSPRDDFERRLCDSFQKTKLGNSDTPLFAERTAADGRTYEYYQTVYAKRSCLECHAGAAGRRGDVSSAEKTELLTEGDLMAIVQVTL